MISDSSFASPTCRGFCPPALSPWMFWGVFRKCIMVASVWEGWEIRAGRGEEGNPLAALDLAQQPGFLAPALLSL